MNHFTLVEFLWISRRIRGGINIRIRLHSPLNVMAVGYIGGAEEISKHGDSAKGSLILGILEVEFIRIRITDERLWEE